MMLFWIGKLYMTCFDPFDSSRLHKKGFHQLFNLVAEGLRWTAIIVTSDPSFTRLSSGDPPSALNFTLNQLRASPSSQHKAFFPWHHASRLKLSVHQEFGGFPTRRRICALRKGRACLSLHRLQHFYPQPLGCALLNISRSPILTRGTHSIWV